MNTASLTFQDKSILQFAQQSSDLVYPRFAQVLNHVQRYGVNILNYPDTAVPTRVNGIPSVMQLDLFDHPNPVYLNEKVQHWMFSLMQAEKPDGWTDAMLMPCWRNAYMSSKAFTNKTGWDWVNEGGELVYADYVQETGLWNKTGFRLCRTISHGATIKVLREPFMKGGKWRVEFEVIDINDPMLETYKYKTHPYLMFPAVNWYRFPLPYGQADPFPKLEERDVIIPLLAGGTNKGHLELDWIRWVENGESAPLNPYWKGV